MNLFKTLALFGLVLASTCRISFGADNSSTVNTNTYYINETYRNISDRTNPLIPPHSYILRLKGVYANPSAQYLDSDQMRKYVSDLAPGSVLILTGRYMPPKQQLQSMKDYCQKINVEFRVDIKQTTNNTTAPPQ